jgi:RNA polymerase sigma factor (sigma-70 family)
MSDPRGRQEADTCVTPSGGLNVALSPHLDSSRSHTVRPDRAVTVARHEEASAQLAAASRDAETFFRQYRGWLLAYCTSRLGSRDEAEDALQSVYVNAWRALQRGATPRHPGAWLFAVARNVCHERLRARSQRSSRELPYEPEMLAKVAAPAPAPAPVGQLADQPAAVGALPENQNRALLLRALLGLSYD